MAWHVELILYGCIYLYDILHGCIYTCFAICVVVKNEHNILLYIYIDCHC